MNRITYDDYSSGEPCAGSVTCENLRGLSMRQSAELEARLLEIEDVADRIERRVAQLIAEGLTPLDAVSCIADEELIPDFCYVSHGFALEKNSHRVEDYVSELSLYDRVLLSESLCSGRELFTEADFLPEACASESFTYVKNSFSDEAFDVFSQDFRDPRVFYSTDLKSCVCAVDDGRYGYCLLPLEERGVRLPTVAELILKYDLKINSVIPVFGLDGAADMKYALICRGFMLHPRADGDDRYLEVRLDGGESLPELCLAVKRLGFSVYRINTVTIDGVSRFSVVLRDEGRDFTSLLLYLSLFASDAVFVGLYKNLE